MSAARPHRPAPAGLPERPRETIAARLAMPTPSRARVLPSAGALARRQAVMRALRVVLPGMGFALLTLLLLWPELEGKENRLSFRQGTGVAAAHVSQPLFQGTDEQRRPYTISAEMAQQVQGRGGPGAEVVALTGPRADITLTDGAWLLLEARAGEYDRGRNLLELTGDVTLWHDAGTRFHTQAATLDLAAGSANGPTPIEATGPFGSITGEGFEIRERGAAIIFTGRARAVLEGEAR